MSLFPLVALVFILLPRFSIQISSSCPSGCVECGIINNIASCYKCASGYLLSNEQCESCPSNCGTCSDSSTCTACNSGFQLYQNQCYNPCPATTYASGTICQSCSSHCDTCSDSSTCTTCSSTFYLSNSLCVDTCPTTTYVSGSACAACPSNCNTCSDSSTCTACSSGYKLYKNQCYNPCPVTTYTSGTKCQDCPSNCDACSDSSTCTMCSSSFYLYNGQCYKPCPTDTYVSGSNCANCPSNCDTCADSSTCTVCSSGYKLYQNQCYNPCPVTTFANGNICSHCPSNCDVCTDGNTCTTCGSSYFLYQAQCYSPCPVTTYPVGSNCLDCSNFCDTCIDRNTCTVCIFGYYFYQQNCSVKCPSQAPYVSPTVSPYTCYETCPPATPYSYQNLCRRSCPAEAPYLMDNVCSSKSSAATTAKAANSAASTASTALAARSVASVSNPSLFMFGSLMKLLEYTRYVNVSHSDSLEILFQTISDSSDLIPMPSMSDEMQNAFKSHSLPDVFARYDLPSNFMLSEGDDILEILTILGLFMLAWLMQKGVYYLRNVSTMRSLVIKSRIFFQNYLIGKFYEMLGDILFAAVFEFQTFSLSDRYSWLSLIACLSCLVLGVILYGVNFWIIYAYQKKKSILQKEELEKFAEKYNGIEVLFGDFGDESFLQQAALIFFVGRSILSSLVIAVFYSMPLFQTAILLILSSVIVIYYITIRPMKSLLEFLEQLSFEILLLAVNACFFIQALFDSMQGGTQIVVKAIGEVVIVLNTIFKFLPLVFLAIQFVLMTWKYYKLFKLALKPEVQNRNQEETEKKKISKQPQNDSSLLLGSNQTLNQSTFETLDNLTLDQNMTAHHQLDFLRRNQRLKQKSETPLRDANNLNKRTLKPNPLARNFVPAKKALNPAVVTALRMRKLAGKSFSPKRPMDPLRIQKIEQILEIPRAAQIRKRIPKPHLLKNL